MEMDHIELASLDDAMKLLQNIQEGRFTDEQASRTLLTFKDELAEVKLVINGADYFGTVPGDLARGIWEYQSELYRAAAYALYGSNDSRKLTTEQRETFELIFKVNEGSSELIADIKDTIEALKGCLDGMTGTQKLVGAILLAIVITGGYTAMHLSDNNKEVALAQEQTKQGETIKTTAVEVLKTQQIAQRYAEANSTGLIAIAKSACDATNIQFGRAHLDAADISDINRKAERTKATAEVVEGLFMVYELNSKVAGKTAGLLCDPLGREFPFSIDEDEFDKKQVEDLWTAARLRKHLPMQVTLTVSAEGAVKKTQVISINQ